MKVSLTGLAAAGLSAALAFPLVAQGTEDRQGNIPVAIDAIGDPNFFAGDVVVDQYAPLGVFGGSGKVVAIDGRPVEMLKGAAPHTAAPDRDSPRAPLLAGQVGQLGVLPGSLQLMHPVTTRNISSPYGWRKNPTGPGNQIHIGQDYPIACGSPVYAAEAGRVVISGWRGHSGNRVTIDHGNNVHTGYSHNSRLLVGIGDEVEQGQLIARSGTTGNSTGCHVHFEVIVDGRWHDPRNYLPGIPGQRQAMIDSRRLTVKSPTLPGGGQHREEPTPPVAAPDPDVVVPEDETPVVPQPKPSKRPSSAPPTRPAAEPSQASTRPDKPHSSPPPSASRPAPPSSTSPSPEESSTPPSAEGSSPSSTVPTASPTPTDSTPPSSTSPSPEESSTPPSAEGSGPSSTVPTASPTPTDSTPPETTRSPQSEPSESTNAHSRSAPHTESPDREPTHSAPAQQCEEASPSVLELLVPSDSASPFDRSTPPTHGYPAPSGPTAC
ncbi:peptidoglycan DD-metalloendopeptidase family protein [Glutamicibacter creatinolyticus]|uniref:M23 family metallopeptidase n=1 Tax=Glutamicibacter creatinolyticus TaxID=162496 RepID=UPI0031D5AACA